MKAEQEKIPAYKFDPTKPVSHLAARLLSASNGLHSHPTDGWPVSEPFTTRHGVKPVRS